MAERLLHEEIKRAGKGRPPFPPPAPTASSSPSFDVCLRAECRMPRAEQKAVSLGKQLQASYDQLSSAAAQAESEQVEHQLEKRGREELERRSSQLEDVLRSEGEATKARCASLEAQLESAHQTITALQERLAAMYAERTSETSSLQNTIAVLHAEKHGMEEVVRVLKGETETMRAHATLADERCHELERLKQELLSALDAEKAERKAAAAAAMSERRRAEVEAMKVGKLRDESAEGRRMMSEHSQAARMMQRGLEAQIASLRHDRRQQVVGYCAELAKWG